MDPAIVVSAEGVVSLSPLNDGTKKVGVGTLVPVEKLHIVGNQYLDGDLIIRSSKRYALAPTSRHTLDRLSPEMSKWSFRLEEKVENDFLERCITILNDFLHDRTGWMSLIKFIMFQFLLML